MGYSLKLFLSDIRVMCLLEDRPNLSLIGKNSNCGKFLAVLFLFSFISLLINFGLFLLIIICQAAVIYLDAKKIREENNNIGPNPIVYAFLTLVFWIIIVPFYIVYRQRFEEKGSSCENPKKTTFKTNAAGNKVVKSQINTKSQQSLINETPKKTMDQTHNNYYYGSRGRCGDYCLKSDLMIKPVEIFFEGPIEVNHNISGSINKSPEVIPNLLNSHTSTISKRSSISDINTEIKINIDDISEKVVQPQSETITWAGDSKEIRIHNYLIPKPLIYWTTQAEKNTEASCINLNLPVGKPINEAKGALGYWPKYSTISPDQRANYLQWLSSRRSEDLSDIGYAFLFFYGLEYRGLVEKKDISIIIQEVNTLLKTFTISSSFFSYLSSFLAYISAINLSDISDENFNLFFPNLLDLSYEQVLVALAWYTNNKKPISWEIAYSLANTIPETPKSVITQKLSNQFKQLFEKKFKSLFPNGMILEPSARKYNLNYRPASPSLLPYYQNSSKGIRIDSIEIGNPLGKKSQFKKIFAIWTETIDELKPAARKIGKGEQELTALAYQLLPDSLKQEIDHPNKPRWDEIFTTSNHEGEYSHLPISSLANLLQIEKRERLTPTQSKLIFSTARDIGYILIPDPRITGTPYRWNDNVAMYPLPKKEIFTSESYPTVAFILELGMSIALVDGVISQEEKEHLERFVFGSFELTPLDVECLKQYQQILILNPPSLEKLGTRLKEHLTETNKLIIAKYLRDMASVDGILDPSEYKALNKIFKSMGLGKEDLQTLFPSDLTKKPSEQPIQISQSSSTIIGESIAPYPTHELSFSLDSDLIDERMRKSLEIRQILDGFLNTSENEELDSTNKIDDDKIVNPQLLTEPDISPISSLNGLPPKYIPVLNEMISKNSLTKLELQKICRNYNFMFDATIEEINTWSEENYGDYLFEQTNEDEILYNSDIRVKIQEDFV